MEPQTPGYQLEVTPVSGQWPAVVLSAPTLDALATHVLRHGRDLLPLQHCPALVVAALRATVPGPVRRETVDLGVYEGYQYTLTWREIG